MWASAIHLTLLKQEYFFQGQFCPFTFLFNFGIAKEVACRVFNGILWLCWLKIETTNLRYHILHYKSLVRNAVEIFYFIKYFVIRFFVC